MPTLERRTAAEVRPDGRRLVGYAATFGTEARISGFTETIRPGAFRSSLLSGADVLALVDHDPTKVLARTKTGTLTLSEDAKGLAFAVDLPDTQAGRDVLALAKRGDLGGMSFGFRVVDEHWPVRDRRELRAVDLHEISVVSAWPAYGGTSVDLRSKPTGLRLMTARRYLELIGRI
jgi:HK97 family phage prohead protease